MQRHEGGYYVASSVVDRPGAMGAIAARMGERMISLEAIMQKRATKEAAPRSVVPVVLMTHGTTEASIRDALEHTSRTASCARSRRSFASSAKPCERRLTLGVSAAVSGEAEDRRMGILAIALMCGAMMCFTGHDTCAKWLSFVFAVGADRLGAVCWGGGDRADVAAALSRPSALRLEAPWVQLVRSLLLFCSTGRKRLPSASSNFGVRDDFVSDAIFVALLAGPVLGERVGAERVVASRSDFLAWRLRPGQAPGFQPIVLLAVAGVVCNSAYVLATRKLAGAGPPQTTLAWTQIAGSFSDSRLPWVWRQPGGGRVGW